MTTERPIRRASSGHLSQASVGARSRPRARPRRPTARRNTASGRPTTGRMSPAGRAGWRPAWPTSGLRRGDRLVVVGDNRPRLYWAMCAAQALGGVPVPLYQDSVDRGDGLRRRPRRGALRGRRGPGAGRQAARGPASVPAARAHRLRRSARAAALRAGPAVLADAAGARARGSRAAARPASSARWPRGAAATTRDHALHLGHHRPAQGRDADARQPDRAGRRSAGAEFDGLSAGDEVLAYLPMAWVGDHIFSYAQGYVVGFCVNCPESGGHGADRPAGDRADLLTSRRRASARTCSPRS